MPGPFELASNLPDLPENLLPEELEMLAGVLEEAGVDLTSLLRGSTMGQPQMKEGAPP